MWRLISNLYKPCDPEFDPQIVGVSFVGVVDVWNIKIINQI